MPGNGLWMPGQDFGCQGLEIGCPGMDFSEVEVLGEEGAGELPYV